MKITMPWKYHGMLRTFNPIEQHGGVVFEDEFGPKLIYFNPQFDWIPPKVIVTYFNISENVLEHVSKNLGIEGDAKEFWKEEVDDPENYRLFLQYSVSENVVERARAYELAACSCWIQGASDDCEEISFEECHQKYDELLAGCNIAIRSWW